MGWRAEPLAPTREEAVRYIQTELEAAVPKGWVLRSVEGDALAWTIVKTDIRSGEWPNREYGVRASKSLELLVFTHGNKDVGPLSLHHVLLRALVIDATAIRHFGLAACLEHLMTRYEPNQWGYT
jgi:hypothetical protein